LFGKHTIFSEENPYNDTLQNQREPAECLISKVKNPLNEQPYGT